MKTQKFRNSWTNVISHCVYCQGTILWDSFGNSCILKFGNYQVFDCMQHGCGLIIQRIPEDCSTSEEVASLLLVLIEDGIPSDVAESAALRLVDNHMAA